jgi:hypothetical protein
MTKPKWTSEAAMLTAFVAEATAMGFRCVPESCGHDLVLIAGPDIEDGLRRRHWTTTGIVAGDVVAVEGKLVNNVTVLRQAAPPHRRRWVSLDCAGADFYCIVTPWYDGDFAEVAGALDICVAEMRAGSTERYSAAPRLVRFDIQESHRCFPATTVRPTHLDVAITPGLPSPRPVTPWKLAAVRFCLSVGDGREFTAKEMPKELAARTFADRSWIREVRREGRAAVYVLAEHPRRPDLEYPEIVAALDHGAPL